MIIERLNTDKLLNCLTVGTDTLNTVNCKNQPVFEHLGYKYGDFPASEKASREVLSLPMHPFLTPVEQKEVTLKLIELQKQLFD